MHSAQKKLYNSVLKIVHQQVKEKISAGGVKGAKIAIFDALLKLRQPQRRSKVRDYIQGLDS